MGFFRLITVKKLFYAIVFVAILGLGWKFWYSRAIGPVDANDQTRTTVQIPQGSSLKAIASLLSEKNLIRSPRAFQMYARDQGMENVLKAGSFVLKPSLNVAEILDILSKGFSEEMVITIPEGFTLKDIDALLAEKEIAKPGDVTACARTCDFSSFSFLPASGKLAERGGKLEGYLYPDTYFVSRENFQPQAFLERLLSTFEKRVVTGLAEDIKVSKYSLHEIVTMASLVEEESRASAERPIVSGILWKRFDAGQMLGVDAAVRYIVNKPTSAITRADLDIDSPYNLRKVAGLPPGPIASPSLSSLKATMHPEESPYWYYLHGTDGKIRYGRTNDEHNENRRLYLP